MVVLHRLTPDADAARTAVLLPGRGYTAQAPLLHWSGLILAEAGWNVHAVAWTDAAADDPAAFGRRAWADVTALLEGVPDLVVAKSLGTFAAPLAIAAGIPGVWLTPLVHHDVVAQALTRHPRITSSWREQRMPPGAATASTALGRTSPRSPMPTTAC